MSPAPKGLLAKRLEHASTPLFIVVATVASFSAYFCMYAFRKPFTAASFSGEFWGPLELKTALVISQMVGYAVSKYLGIKVCSESRYQHRAAMLVVLVAIAEFALVLFAVLPGSWKVAAIFLNGLPLGMVWGLIVGFLEGRRTSDLLMAGLSCSFIVSSGVVKDVGRALMQHADVAEIWMPALTGAIFFPPFLLAVWLLQQLPRPNRADVAERVERDPMHSQQRRLFVRRYLPSLLPLFAAYVLLTAYRDFRDSYGVEILDGLGHGDSVAIFTRIEVPVALVVLCVLASMNLIRNSSWALRVILGVMTCGPLLLGLGTWLHAQGTISGAAWMVWTGIGSYLAYVPFGAVLFERWMAGTRTAGTALFAVYVGDALGYTGSVVTQVFRDLFEMDATRLEFFRGFSWLLAAVGTALLGLTTVLVLRHREGGDRATLDPRSDLP